MNTTLRATWPQFADGLVDVAADPRIGLAGDEINRRYYAKGRVHLDNLGLGSVTCTCAVPFSDSNKSARPETKAVLRAARL